MEFGERIRSARKRLGLTQEQMAARLGVSRQAVSNWENDRNLPDIELLISMALEFGLSLDDLILGDRSAAMKTDEKNQIADKLIRDGSEGRRSRWLAITACVGAALLLGAVLLFVIRSQAPEPQGTNMDANLWMSVLVLLMMLGALMAFMTCGIGAAISLARTSTSNRALAGALALLIAAVIGIAVFFAVLIVSNMAVRA